MGKERRELYIEGVAIHGGPESCADVREGVGEALAGVRVGRAIEPRNQREGFQNAGSARERSAVALSSVVAPLRGGAIYRVGARVRIPDRAGLRNRLAAAPDQSGRPCCPWRRAMRVSAHAPFFRLSRLFGCAAVAG